MARSSSPNRLAALVALAVAAILAVLLWWKPWQSSEEPVVRETANPSLSPSGTSAPRPLPPPAPPASNAPAAPLRLVPAIVEDDPTATTGRFAGRVVNWGSGEGVSGAELVFSGPGNAMTIRSDATGAFVFSPPATGAFKLATVSADGFLPYAPAWGASAVSLEARAGARVSGVVFYLTPAIRYQGRVLDASGAPVTGAEVVLVSSGSGSFDLLPITDRFASDDDGSFEFSAPDNAVLEARHAGRVGRGRVDGPVQISRRLIIALGAKGAERVAVVGQVVDVAGAPVSEALVRARRGKPGQGPPPAVRADDEGRFRLELEPRARYLISARAPDHAPGTATVDVGEPGSEHRVTVTLSASASIAGRVQSEGGAPVGAFSVVVSRRVGIAESVVATASVFDSEGRFEIRGFPEGEYRVSAAAYGFAPAPPVSAHASARADDGTGVVITLPLGGTLIGRILDAESKEPLALARVVAEGSMGGGTSAVPIASSVVTDDDGRFELAGLPPGKASVVAAAADHHSQIVGGLSVVSGARLGPIDVELTPTEPGETPKIELAGIGAALAARDDGLLVQKLIDGGGALEAGLAVGDMIVAVDGKPVSELGFQGAIQEIRGPVNTPVSLSVRKAGAGPVVELETMRRKIRA